VATSPHTVDRGSHTVTIVSWWMTFTAGRVYMLGVGVNDTTLLLVRSLLFGRWERHVTCLHTCYNYLEHVILWKRCQNWSNSVHRRKQMNNEPCAARFRPASEIRTKATPCVEVWQTSNRRGKKEEERKKKPQGKNIMVCPIS